MFKKTIVSVISAFTLIHSFAFAQAAVVQQEADDGQVLRRIEGKLDQVLDNSAENRKAFVDQPLGERKNGIELNFFRLLMWDEGEKSLSGTYSRFYTDKNVEIAVPFMYSSGEQERYSSGSFQAAGDLESTTVDVHYRKYLGHNLDGFYLSGFTRVAHLNGNLDQPYNSSAYNSGSETKLGVGVGVGYRIISSSGLYWGMSLSVGRYLTGDSDIFVDSDSISSDLDDSSVIVDVEFFKFGYAF